MKRSSLLRALAGVASLALLIAVVRYAGFGAMLAALRRVVAWVPCLLALEGGIVAANALALSALYRAAGHTAPRRAFWRAVYVSNLAAVCLPLGRVVGEAWKAARLSLWIGGPTAAAGAVGLQAAVLLGNATIALLALVGVALRCGSTWPTLAVGVFALSMIVAGGAVAFVGRASLGRWMGKRFEFARAQGAAFDEAFVRASTALRTAAAYASAARVLQFAQVVAVLYALGHRAGLVNALATYGLVLTGSAMGDALPAQIGATDALLTAAARHVHLPIPDALALTLCLHGAQVVLALVAGPLAFLVREEPAPAALVVEKAVA